MKIKIQIILIILSSFIIANDNIGATKDLNLQDHILKIESHLTNNDYLGSYSQFNQAILEFDASADLYFKGASIAVKLDKLDEANKYFIKAIELDNKNNDYRKAQENLLSLKNAITNARKTFDSGRIDEAISEYLELCIIFPENAIIFYNLGRMYKVNQNYDKAVEYYKIAFNINPFEEKYDLAIKAIAQQITKQGDTEYRRQEFDVAIQNYKSAIEYYPIYTTAYFKLARTYFKIKDYENTKIFLEMNLIVDPRQEQSEKMLGDIYLSTGDIDSALIHYNKAVYINSNYYKAFYSLGTTLMKIKKFDEAEEALKKSVLLEPSYSKAYGALGIIYQSTEKFELSIENFKKCINLDPKAFKIFYRLASVYNILKEYEKAKISAKSCLNIKRNYAPSYFELGLSEKALGNKVAAKDAFEKAKKDKNWRKSAQYELDMLQKGY